MYCVVSKAYISFVMVKKVCYCEYFCEILLTNGKGMKKSIKMPFYVLFSSFIDANIAHVKYAGWQKTYLIYFVLLLPYTNFATPNDVRSCKPCKKTIC